ncbi:type II secretion system F family protein [Naasia sp. SYSU D00948]|uniref:type II secretion system F family protein n=1 Tax=Naasia sp. SYSU D00948 TaxID=2817379 RepID=UPI001B315AE1|nr:type II secretion system F family protein [Naasia sp. SYSU D00948]
MQFYVPLLAAVAAAGGVGALAFILISGFRPKTAGADEVPVSAPAPQRRPVGERVAGRVPAGYTGWIARNIVLAGRPAGWSVGRTLLAKPFTALPIALLGWFWVMLDPAPWRILVTILFVTIAFFVPELLVYNRAVKRQQEIDLALPDTLDQMTISVEAGLGFESAMSKAATNGHGPLADELVRTLQDMSIGRPRRDAYQALTDRTKSPDLRRFTRAVVQADQYGIAIADVLKVQAGEMRLKRRQRAEEQAMKVPVKVLFPLMFCILPVLFIVLLTPAALNALTTFN